MILVFRFVSSLLWGRFVAGILSNAIAWLPSALGSANGIPDGVTLARGEDQTEKVPAIRAWHAAGMADSGGFTTDYQPYDYLIAATDYVIADEQVEPEQGDRLTEPLGTFEVLPVAGGPCVHYREDGLFRVHTKRVG